MAYEPVIAAFRPSSTETLEHRHRSPHRHPERTQPRQQRGNVAVAFSPDGKIVATANLNGVTYLWGIATGRTRR